MNVSTATTIIRDRLGEESAYADFWSDAEILRALNEGQRRFCMEEKWPWLYTTATGQVLANDETVTLELGISFPRHWNFLLTPDGETRPYMPRKVSPYDGFRLRTDYYTAQSYISWVYVESSVANPDDVDNDSAYELTLRLVPTPSRDHDYDFQYIRLPETLVNTTDLLDVPDEYAMGPVSYALHLLWRKELNWSQKADEAGAEYAFVVDQARKDLRRQAPDEGVAWGRSEPEFYGTSVADYAKLRMPTTLGP